MFMAALLYMTQTKTKCQVRSFPDGAYTTQLWTLRVLREGEERKERKKARQGGPVLEKRLTTINPVQVMLGRNAHRAESHGQTASAVLSLTAAPCTIRICVSRTGHVTET